VQIPDHHDALKRVLSLVDPSEIYAIGHRVVHGGQAFSRSMLVDSETLAALAKLDQLAPLHNPVNRMGIEMALELYPDAPQVAVFDTAFHADMPEHAYRYAIPAEWSDQLGVRRYGFHGTSHKYVAERAAAMLDVPPRDLNLITLHLGNGASAAAVSGGRCLDTSMGLTPLEGLVMGTRSGDLDPGALLYLMREGYSAAELDEGLNRYSGLQGLCDENDMRAVKTMAAEGDRRARLALDIYCYRIRKYIGAFCAVLGRVDAIIFTAGIGEHDPEIRETVIDGIGFLGVQMDLTLNRADSREARAVHLAGSAVAVLVIPTDEELQSAREVQAVLQSQNPDERPAAGR
jgi:acetate kinase